MEQLMFLLLKLSLAAPKIATCRGLEEHRDWKVARYRLFHLLSSTLQSCLQSLQVWHLGEFMEG